MLETRKPLPSPSTTASAYESSDPTSGNALNRTNPTRCRDRATFASKASTRLRSAAISAGLPAVRRRSPCARDTRKVRPAIAATIDIARTGDVRAAPSPVKNDESASFMTSGPQLRKQPCQSFLTRVTGCVDESHTCTHTKLKGGSGQSYPRRSKGSACRCYLPVLTGLADFRRADPRRQRLPPRASIASTHRTFHLSVMHRTVSALVSWRR